MNKIPEFQQSYYSALVFACEKHASQFYDRDKPYIFHLVNVCMTLTRFGFSLENHIHLHLAGILHDVVEDTTTKLSEVRKLFGDEVADIVNLVTDEKGETRKERHEKTYPVLASNRDAILVKLADRITNVEYSIATSNLKQFRKYQKEYVYFRKVLYFEDHVEATKMWKCLDEHFLIEGE